MTSQNAKIKKEIEENAFVYQALRRSDFIFQVRQKMVDKGIKNSDIAERVGVSEANVSRWLKGNQNITIDTLYLLADAIEEPLTLSVGATVEVHPLCAAQTPAWEDASAMILMDVSSDVAANVFFMAEHPKVSGGSRSVNSGGGSYNFVGLGVDYEYSEARA